MIKSSLWPLRPSISWTFIASDLVTFPVLHSASATRLCLSFFKNSKHTSTSGLLHLRFPIFQYSARVGLQLLPGSTHSHFIGAPSPDCPEENSTPSTPHSPSLLYCSPEHLLPSNIYFTLIFVFIVCLLSLEAKLCEGQRFLSALFSAYLYLN